MSKVKVVGSIKVNELKTIAEQIARELLLEGVISKWVLILELKV